MFFSLNFRHILPPRSGLLWPLVAALRPSAEALLAGGEVQLRLGDRTITASLPSADASPQAAGRAVASLLELVDESGLKIGGLRLVASDCWLRPLVCSLGEQALSDAELDSVLAHQYQQVYGKSMAGWGWRWDRQPNGLLLSMAWPDSLLALRTLLAERGIRLVSALPQSLSTIRGLTMPSGQAWFVLVSMASLSFVRLDADGWRQWRVVVANGASPEFVSSHLLRMVAQLDDECRGVWIAAPGVSAEWSAGLRALLVAAGWQVHLAGKAK